MTVYRRKNPLLMTVMGANPRRLRRQDDPIDKAIEQACYRLMSGVQVSVMDIPKIFRDVKLEMAAGMPLEEAVARVGSRYRVNRNPGLLASAVGGMAGAVVAKAISNPGRMIAFGKCRIHGRKKCPHRHSRCYCASLVESTCDFCSGQRRANPSVRRNMPASAAWDRMTDRQRIWVLGFAGVAREGVDPYVPMSWQELPLWIKKSLRSGWRRNPAKSPWAVCRAAQKKHGFGKRKYERCVRKVKAKGNPLSKREFLAITREAKELHRQSEEKESPWARGYYRGAGDAALGVARRYVGPARNPVTVRKNPKGRRKITMSLQKFAELVKRKGDPKLWQDFLRKVKGYQKWTHGTLPEKVTVELVEKAGMSGLWVTYDAGRAPESTYVMPTGSKRKGAWKHPWDTMPRIKHDPESGIILQKLGGRSAITDFYHR